MLTVRKTLFVGDLIFGLLTLTEYKKGSSRINQGDRFLRVIFTVDFLLFIAPVGQVALILRGNH